MPESQTEYMLEQWSYEKERWGVVTIQSSYTQKGYEQILAKYKSLKTCKHRSGQPFKVRMIIKVSTYIECFSS